MKVRLALYAGISFSLIFLLFGLQNLDNSVPLHNFKCCSSFKREPSCTSLEQIRETINSFIWDVRSSLCSDFCSFLQTPCLCLLTWHPVIWLHRTSLPPALYSRPFFFDVRNHFGIKSEVGSSCESIKCPNQRQNYVKGSQKWTMMMSQFHASVRDQLHAPVLLNIK